MNARHPTGTLLGRALAQAPAPEPLPLDEHMPRPPLRYGDKIARYRATLLTMHGDQSFTVLENVTVVYNEAKKLGIKIMAVREGKGHRVWRVK